MANFETTKYNFGVRKPVLNCKNIINTGFWKTHLINKWIYSYENSEETYIYFKHIFVSSRIIQIIISGIDILGDGVYTIYKADILSHSTDFMLVPTEYNLTLGSFECENYLKELLVKGYISEDDYKMFNNPEQLRKARESMYEMSDRKFQD